MVAEAIIAGGAIVGLEALFYLSKLHARLEMPDNELVKDNAYLALPTPIDVLYGFIRHPREAFQGYVLSKNR